MDDNKKSSKGLSNFLNKIIFTDHEEEAPSTPQEMKATRSTASTSSIRMPSSSKSNKSVKPTGSAVEQELVKKIHDFVQSINAPGVDFLELWNVANAMEGGVNQQNLNNAYTTLKIVSNNSLSLGHIESSANTYIHEIQSLLSGDVIKKQEEKARLEQEVTLKKGQLEEKVLDLNSQIAALQKKLTTAQNNLQQIHGKYDPQISEIDEKINAGKRASKLVIDEINSVLSMIKKTIKD